MSQNAPDGVRKPVLYAAVFLVVAVAGAVAFKKMNRAPAEPPAVAEAAPKPGYVRPKPVHSVGTSGGGDEVTDPAAVPPAVIPDSPKPAKPLPAPMLAAPQVTPSPETRGLVSALASIDLKSTPLTAESAAAWKQNLAQLVQGGAASLPAIQEFLALNKDVGFDGVPGAAALLGSSSLRLSLLGALGSINGPEALVLSAQVLQSTTDPREIMLLAQNLERQAPEQYREAALAAARAAMAEAGAGRLTGKDIGPLFELLKNYGGANSVQDFQQAASGQWKYYATIALADLPDGAGVPALTQMITDPKNPAIGGRVAALQALAQLAPDNADARNVMLEQARQGNIPGATWINIAASLAGDKFQIGNASTENNPNLRTWHLAYGNQNYHATPVPLTPEQVQQRLGLVDQFLALNNNNPIANSALQDARNKLAARSGASVPR